MFPKGKRSAERDCYAPHDNINYAIESSLTIVRFLREEIELDWDIRFTKDGVLKSKIEVLRYALKDGCPYIPWHLKMYLHSRLKDIKDDWFKEFYNNL